MASSQEPNPRASRARRSVPVAPRDGGDRDALARRRRIVVGEHRLGDGTTTTGSVIVECRSGVVTEGDVSMSAMSVTRVDAVPSELPGGCRVAS